VDVGLLVVDKPSGTTSRGIVNRVVPLFPRAKVGHAGTLDPLASGILIVCVGPATRLVEMIQRMPKTYRTAVRMGARSDTCDADGRINAEPSPRIPHRTEVESALAAFHGSLLQVPPAYSALKIKGRRAYALARAGAQPELSPRLVQIDRVELLSYAWPTLELEIECGSGTYIRSIARDLGESLGCGGYVETLVRTKVGPFGLEQAMRLADLSSGSIRSHLKPALAAVPNLPKLVLRARQLEDVAQGRTFDLDDLDARRGPSGPVALLDLDGRLVALAELDPTTSRVQPRKVLI
jgi:tRNA pseudouridine55 synthase